MEVKNIQTKLLTVSISENDSWEIVLVGGKPLLRFGSEPGVTGDIFEIEFPNDTISDSVGRDLRRFGNV